MKVKADAVTRRGVADLLRLHPDSVTRNLAQGLAGAVLSWGGQGKEMTFSRSRVLRWAGAWSCRRRNQGEPCGKCYDVLYDMVAVGEHLQEAGHGYRGCRECDPSWALVQPCSPAAGGVGTKPGEQP